MGVFRINKTQDYVVMSNHHLRNKNLTLKAKGLLSQMLSLPDDWDYTLAGLTHINKESIDAVRTAVWELEKEGYIEKTRERDDKGKLGGTIYNIYELPQKNTLDPKPQTEKKPNNKTKTDNLNKTNIKAETAEKLQNLIITSSNLAQVNQPKKENDDDGRERIGKQEIKEKDIYKYKEFIKNKINYDEWVKNIEKDKMRRIDEIINIIIEVLSSQKKTITIARDDYPAEFVKERFKKIDSEHISFILGCMKENNTKIRNMKNYLKTVLFNAPITIDNYYQSLAQHDIKRMRHKRV